jgi:hypothetical protein
MAELAAEPLTAAHRVPSVRAPVYIAVVPLQPPALVTFLHAFQFHTVKLLAIRPARNSRMPPVNDQLAERAGNSRIPGAAMESA